MIFKVYGVYIYETCYDEEAVNEADSFKREKPMKEVGNSRMHLAHKKTRSVRLLDNARFLYERMNANFIDFTYEPDSKQLLPQMEV